LPWEETGDYVRSGHRDPSACQKGSFRTITISEDEGIQAVICKPLGSDSTVTQSFLFAKAKGWTLQKAKEWFNKHETASAGTSVQYCVRAQAIEQDGKKYALIEVIDENISGPCEQPPATKVRINPAGKARALASILDRPLLGPPELGHEATEVVGYPVDFTSNHATRVLYEIPDSGNWDRIDRHEWGPVSPKMTSIEAHYEEDTFVLDEWTWDNVAFVPKGAFPNAGVKSTCIGDPRLCGFTPEKPWGFYRAIAAAANSSESRLKAQRPRTETDVGSSPQETGTQDAREKTRGHPETGVAERKSEEVACVTCEHEKVIAELTDKNTKLETEAKDLKAKLATLTEAKTEIEAELKELKEKPPAPAAPVAASDAMLAVQAELKTLKAENEALKAWKVAAEEADHMKRVQDVVDLRIKNGVLDPKNVQASVDSLKKLPNDALDAMKGDLEAVKGKFDSLPSGPKARLIPSVAARFDPMQPTVGDLVGKKPGEK
jgi:hypothetical protein